MTRIVTERLVLRLPTPEDDLTEFAADVGVQAWLGPPAPDLLDLWIRRWERNGIGQFVVELVGAIVGRVGYVVWDSRTWDTSAFDLAGEHAEVELGWAILSPHWGKGYATEAARAALDWIDPKRVISLIAPENARSQRVADKLGAIRTERVETPHGPADVWVHLA